jgi:hypothetical protein
MWFAYTAPRTIQQMKAYRWANNLLPDSQKTDKEKVFKLNDELPDCVRYTVMAWPHLPDAKIAEMTDAQKSRWDRLDDRSRMDIERVRAYNQAQRSNDLEPAEEGYPLGGFFSTGVEESGRIDW